MFMSRLTALALTSLLSCAAFAVTLAEGTGPTNPVEGPKAPAIQSAPGMNTDGTAVDSSLPPATGIDPRIQGNDAGRQGGLNMPDTQSSDNSGTTGGSGPEDGANQ